MDGYIFVHRKIMDSPVFADPWLFKIWMWCLFKANYAPKKVNVGNEVITLERGQFIYGRKKAVEELSDSKNKISESSFYRRTAFLEKNGSIVQKSNNRYTLVTVVNYDIYQPFFEESEQQVNNGRTTGEHNIINKKNNNILSSSSIACVREQISSDDIIAMEELRNLPLEAQLRFDDITEELIERYFKRECTVGDKATMYWWLELLSSKPQMTDSDLELLSTAFEIAEESGSMNFKYIDGIFNNWADNEIRTIGDYRIHEIRRRK